MLRRTTCLLHLCTFEPELCYLAESDEQEPIDDYTEHFLSVMVEQYPAPRAGARTVEEMGLDVVRYPETGVTIPWVQQREAQIRQGGYRCLGVGYRELSIGELLRLAPRRALCLDDPKVPEAGRRPNQQGQVVP